MRFKNTKDTYGLIAKVFHWPMALIILGLVLVGFYMGSLPNSPGKFEIYALHKSFGLLILWLVGVRILWTVISRSPSAHQNHLWWERLLAKLAHFLLYISMIGMPLSGWLMSSAAEYPAPFFGFQMPDLVGKDPDLAHLMHDIHEILGFVLVGVIALHALGALKHHFMDEDDTLRRMMANPMRHLGPYVLIIILGLFGLGVVKLGIIDKRIQKSEQIVKTSEVEQKQLNAEEVLVRNSWKIIDDQSSLIFKASVYGKEFTGMFGQFGGNIIFDPNDLENSSVDIIIDITNMDSGDSERDSQMMGGEWFNAANYPTARFKTMAFQPAGEGEYVAVGELTIKNSSMPVSLPFQLDIMPGEENIRRAYMTGDLTLSRLDFGLGEGRWEAADSVGLDVVVQVKLVAISNYSGN